jgi:hypothetical protein
MTLPELPGVIAYGVGASASYIAMLGVLAAFGPAPEIVVSGSTVARRHRPQAYVGTPSPNRPGR